MTILYFFKDIDDIRHSFRKFAQLLPDDGTLIVNSEIEHLDQLTEGLTCKIVPTVWSFQRLLCFQYYV